jgi:Fe-S cluster assembly ATP-binding protein
MKTLTINDLHVKAGDKEIIKGIDLEINQGEIHALMGPNGNGKSTLIQAIMGNPAYEVTQGSIIYDGQDVLKMTVDQRSKAGIFLAMQYPNEIGGVTNSEFLRAAINAHNEEPISIFKFIKELDKSIKLLNMKDDLAHRFVNEGFSGGEKKRNEILQMLMLKPTLCMLDEIDSGLDVDALKYVADALEELKKETNPGVLIISHYERFYSLTKPTHAHVLIDGKIVLDGDYELVTRIDSDGYDWLYNELKINPIVNNRPTVYSLGVCAANKVRNNA